VQTAASRCERSPVFPGPFPETLENFYALTMLSARDFIDCRLLHVPPGLHIQKFYMVFTLRLSVRYGPYPCTALTDRFCITEVERVYCAVRTQSLYKTEEFRI
jgi:hypothetical protein